MELETTNDYVKATLRLTMAFSPLIIIGVILFTAREDEEEEKRKLEEAKKAASCKT